MLEGNAEGRSALEATTVGDEERQIELVLRARVNRDVERHAGEERCTAESSDEGRQPTVMAASRPYPL